MGFLHFWGTRVSIISCIDLVMSVGIGVDYSAHVALAFIQVGGEGGRGGKDHTLKTYLDS